ncbi:hypothetical protein C2E21_7292 [Chlorella sorokiniana]|jgi:hypothetical protein|uniref:Uncharacterized protein n=1 Tax=Chlorella sorokiniana TaxID=3076 RepID=A0A2P6THP3_CHLSO|nr:hypothetical protein C2E21_7292 [Chlorella sorokiniana]|eukprot:PRW33799.1 hypothetical protein C2E21_7292 [Chlorella sorokiniana]
MPKPAGTNTAGWLPCAALLLGASTAAVWGPAQSLLKGSLSVPQVLLCDALFTGGAVAFLAAGLSYGLRWHPGATPYKGAWLDDRSVPQLPAGFFAYLQVAGLIAFLLPAGALLALAAGGHGKAGLLVFGGYLLAFVPQMLMEVKLFNRNPLSPAIPFTFGPYRMWQLGRSLWALGAGIPTVAGAPAWLVPFNLFLLAFWIFDHGVTALQLPWVFNWHLQGERANSKSAPSGAAAAAEE